MKSCCKEANDTNDQDELSSEPEGDDEKKNWLWKLKHKWQVKNILQVILILCTFALGGSLCGYLGRRILPHIGLSHPGLKVVVYILLVTVLWPLCVLAISVFFGQFSFFRKYLKKLGNRIIGRKTDANKK
ncbi:MAG: DUF6787 family protein [Taibaiella sp.]|jgi:hypothetical protein